MRIRGHREVNHTCTHILIEAKPTQMPINDRVDKEKIVHMHHGILCNHKKE